MVTAICSIGDENVTFQYAGGKTETETFADVVEQARLYVLTDCGFNGLNGLCKNSKYHLL